MSKWMVTGIGKASENSVQLSDSAPKTRLCPFDPRALQFALPFDHRTHTAVEIDPSDQLFSLVMSHVVKGGVIENQDAISFSMARAENGGKQKPCSPQVPGYSDDAKTIAVSLGTGLFRFTHKAIEFKTLHQQIGDPVAGCGAQVLSNLILFREGIGQRAVREIQAFLADVLAKSEKTAKHTRRIQVYRWHIKYQFWQRVGRALARPISSVVEDFSEFLSDEKAEFDQQHGKPYKRSYLFYGVPGAGKTSMIKALAGKFGLNLCYLL